MTYTNHINTLFFGLNIFDFRSISCYILHFTRIYAIRHFTIRNFRSFFSSFNTCQHQCQYHILWLQSHSKDHCQLQFFHQLIFMTTFVYIYIYIFWNKFSSHIKKHVFIFVEIRTKPFCLVFHLSLNSSTFSSSTMHEKPQNLPLEFTSKFSNINTKFMNSVMLGKL